MELGALASEDVKNILMTADLSTESYWASAVHLVVGIDDETADDGPLDLWVGVSDLTDTEVEEFLEQTLSFAEGNISEKEINSRGRYLRHLGILDTSGEGFNNGRVKKLKLGFGLATGQSIKLFARNMGQTALTSGATIHIQGQLHGNFR